ncbi:MAG: hypothetical protein R2737_16935 [Candidatus Nanopelagicales bacterium]
MSSAWRVWRFSLVLVTGLALAAPVGAAATTSAPVDADIASARAGLLLRSVPPKLKPGAVAGYLRSVKALDQSLQTGLAGSAEAHLTLMADLQAEIVSLLNQGASADAVDAQLQTAKADGDAVGRLLAAFPPMRRGLLATIDGLKSDCANIPCRTMLATQRAALAPELTRYATQVLPSVQRAFYALAAKDFGLYNTHVEAAYDAISARKLAFHAVTVALAKPTRWRPTKPTVTPPPPLAPVTPGGSG